MTSNNATEQEKEHCRIVKFTALSERLQMREGLGFAPDGKCYQHKNGDPD